MIGSELHCLHMLRAVFFPTEGRDYRWFFGCWRLRVDSAVALQASFLLCSLGDWGFSVIAYSLMSCYYQHMSGYLIYVLDMYSWECFMLVCE